MCVFRKLLSRWTGPAPPVCRAQAACWAGQLGCVPAAFLGKSGPPFWALGALLATPALLAGLQKQQAVADSAGSLGEPAISRESPRIPSACRGHGTCTGKILSCWRVRPSVAFSRVCPQDPGLATGYACAL